MTPAEIRNAVCTLQAKGHSLRDISRSLALSRNTYGASCVSRTEPPAKRRPATKRRWPS